MKKSLRTTIANLSCALAGVTALGFSACSFTDSSTQACEHAWNDGEIKTEATCTNDGEMLFTCTKCQETKTEVIPMAHDYVNGVCFDCGYVDPDGEATGNFYFNLIESLATAEHYYVEMSECAMTLTDESEETHITCEELQLTIGLDENGFLCGQGTIQGTIDGALGGESGGISPVTGQVRLEDGFIYLDASGEFGNEELTVRQSDLWEELKSDPQTLVAVSLMETIFAVQEWQELADSIKAVKNNSLNAVIKTIYEYVYTKQSTDGGYAFTLNANRLMDVYSVLEEQTVGGVFNTVFGSNAYTNFVDYLVISVDKTIGEFMGEVELKCEEIGATPETLYPLVNTIVNSVVGEELDEEFDICAMLEADEDTPLVELFNDILGEEHTTQEYQERLRREAVELYSVKVFDTLSAEEKYELEETLTLIVEKLEGSEIAFYTDKAGNLISVNYELKELGDETITIESFKMNFVVNGSSKEE